MANNNDESKKVPENQPIDESVAETVENLQPTEIPEELVVLDETVATPEEPAVIEEPAVAIEPLAESLLPLGEVSEPAEKKPFKLPPTKVILMIAAVVLLAIAFITMVISFASKAKLDAPVDEVTILVKDDLDFAETGSFTVKGLEGFSKAYLETNLYFVPDVDFTVVKNKENFTITFKDYKNIGYLGYFPYFNTLGAERVEIFNVNGSNMSVDITNEDVFIYDSVELLFSEQVDIDSLEKNMTIDPPTPYTLNYDLNNVSIIPANEWNATAQYTITINAAYTSAIGKQFTKEQVLKYHIVRYDDDGNVVKYYPEVLYRNNDNFIVTEDVSFALNFEGNLLQRPVPLTVETYKLGDVEKFKSQGQIYLDYEVDLSRLEKVSTDAFLIEDGTNKILVDNPGAGAYVLSVKYDDPDNRSNTIEKRTSYLVTPYSMYLQSSKNETLAWVHNSVEGAVLDGYKVVFNENDEYSTITDEQGIGVISTFNKAPIVKDDDSEVDGYYYYYGRNRDTEVAQVSIYDPDNKLVYYDDATLRVNTEARRDNYYSYLFTDRTIYRPEDTIKFWGFVKPLKTNTRELPKTATFVFDQAGLNMTVECPINDQGVFTGELKIESIRSADYMIKTILSFPADPNVEGAKDVEVNLNSVYVQVKNFTKPTYILKSSFDKPYYLPDETVTVTASPTFYDGTPLPNFPLEVFARISYSGEWIKHSDITTDSDGNASFSFKVPERDGYYENSVGIEYNYYRVQIATDGEQVTDVNSYPCLYDKYLVEQSFEKQSDNKNFMLTVKTYAIDLTTPAFIKSFEENEGNLWKTFSYENLLETAKGNPVDITVDIGLRWRYMDTKGIKHENRTYSNQDGYFVFDNQYGFDYNYVPPSAMKIVDSWETQEKNIKVTTKNGVAQVSNTIFTPPNTNIDFSSDYFVRSFLKYYEESTNNDDYYTNYKYYPDRASYYNWDYYEESTEKPVGFTYNIYDTVSEEDLTPNSRYYRYSRLNLDNQTHFELLYNGDSIDKKGTILYSTIQNGLYEYHVVDANEFDFTYTIDYGPEVQLIGAYFDGNRVHYIDDLQLSVSRDSLKLDIEVTPDKESYTPGDSVTLDIKTTDQQGKGVAGNLCVAIVDEAVFAVSEQYVNTADDLYSVFWNMDNYVAKYCTTYRSGGANSDLWSGGKGEGDGGAFYDSYRKNFKDTADFIPARTDSSGNAKISFTLPDNVTSWRITTVEIGDDLRAGNGKTNIISTLPFFTSPVVSDKYIDGDEIAVLVQGHGVSLKEDSGIDYSVTLKGDGFEKTLTTSGKAYQPWEFNFGKLPMGRYTLIAKSQFGDYSDTVELPVNVIKSNVELVVNTPIDVKVNSQLDISAVRYPVSLTVYDKDNMPFYDSINSLFGHYCMMPSQRMSRYVAKSVIRASLGDEVDIPYYIAKGNDNVADMQQSDGGIGEYAGSSSEPMLSMYMSMITQGQFDNTMLAEYFRSQMIGDTTTSVVKAGNNAKVNAAMYLGLAALGEVEVKEIYEQLGRDENGRVTKEPDMRLDIKAYYVAALAYLGETKVANEIYNKDLQSHLVGIEKRSIQKIYYYRYTQEDLDWERSTTAIWIAASKLHPTDANRVAAYYNNHSWRYQSLFEGMIFVTNYKMVNNNLDFSYTLGGTTVNDKTDLYGAKTIVLDKSGLESMRFTKLPSNLVVNAYYVGEPTELGIEASDEVKVTKTVTSLGDNTYQVKIKLNFSADAPYGSYDVSDWIPSNSRLYSDSNTSDWYAQNVEGQKIYFTVYRSERWNENVKTLSYKIRQTYNSVAMLDTVYVIHGESGINAMSEKTEFVPDNTVITTPMVHVDSSKNILPN